MAEGGTDDGATPVETEKSNDVNQTSDEEQENITTSETTAAEQPLTNKQRRQAKQAAKQTASEEPKPKKQRRELDVLNRIRWDKQYDPADIIIGYLDRHSEQGILEIPFEAWERESTADEFVPLHRIKYFRRRNETAFLWHRTLAIDKIFDSI